MNFNLIGAILAAQLLISSVGFGAGGAHDGKRDTAVPAEYATPLALSVRIQNYAQVSPNQMKPALREASRIFRQTGVQIDWLDCTPNDVAGHQKHPECDKETSSASIVLRLLPRSMGEKLGFGETSFGYALSLQPGRIGRIASVFVYRMQDLSRRWGGVEQPVVLGHLIAHELGHLVLGEGGHSDSGIMSFPWEGEELQTAVRGGLRFSKKQAGRMRAHVRSYGASVGHDAEILASRAP